MYKLVAFDLDGTLAESKQSITKETATLLYKLASITKVAVISGASFARLEKQFLCCIPPSPNIILLPVSGSERFEYKDAQWQLTDKEPFSADVKKKVLAAFKKIIDDPQYEVPPYPVGVYVEDRDTEITFSGLGQDALPADKEKWDPDKTRRMKIKEELEQQIPEIIATVAGTTSIDVLPKGFDKSKGLSLFLQKTGMKPEEMVFLGDAIVPGGNDYSVFEAGIKSISVSGPAETKEVIEKMLQENITAPEIHPVPEFPKDAVAYFCAEYAFEPNPKMYAGGLGILAGDYVYQAAELNKPFIAIGLRYGDVIPTGFGLLQDVIVDVPIGSETIEAKVWHRAFSSNTHVLLLDAGELTSVLYNPDFMLRIKEQIVLGIGGVRLLKKLNVSPRVYHLNEGHTAFAAVGVLVERPKDADKIVGSKHTILSAAGLQISYDDLKSVIGPYCKAHKVKFETIFEKGKFELSPGLFSTTKCVMECSRKKNGVSAIHVVYEKKKHPQSTLITVTNGVYRKRWQARELLMRAPDMTDENLWKTKRKLRLDLFAYIETTTGKKFNPDICTLVWARRFVEYKRPHLLFLDLERINHFVSHGERPLQIVISGKAVDDFSRAAAQKIIEFSNSPAAKGRVIYLPDYSISSAEKLTRGADVWLNTPELGMEACGTSGMKASLNGAIQVSVRDGWVDEVSLDGIGWALPATDALKTAEVLYDLLDHEILPSFYENSPAWIGRMRSTMELVEKHYTAERMLEDYEEKLYTW